MISRAMISWTRVIKPPDLPRLRANSAFVKLVVSHSGWIAQLVEQWTENPCVAGSIPAPTTQPIARNCSCFPRVTGFFLRGGKVNQRWGAQSDLAYFNAPASACADRLVLSTYFSPSLTSTTGSV
jgi:hypothetical protein